MCSLSGNNKIILKLSNKRSQHSKTWIIYNISKSYDCASHCFFGYLQGAKKVSLTACHSGKLKLTFTSPNIISTSPKNVLVSRLISQFLCKLNSSKNFTCSSGKLITEFTSPIAKSTSPGLLDTTFFAPCYYYYYYYLLNSFAHFYRALYRDTMLVYQDGTQICMEFHFCNKTAFFLLVS